MKSYTRILILLMLGGFALTVYAGSKTGWGISGPMDKQTMQQVKENCPEYYQNRNGDCLRTTFRSYFLIHSIRGGSFGSGK